jgi:hypothetical protein
MMITPEMMDALGAKRGTARKPDQTKVIVEEGTDMFAGGDGDAANLDDAVGEWDGGRKKGLKRKKKKKGGQMVCLSCL